MVPRRCRARTRSEAQLNLGIQYTTESGVAQSGEKAVIWWQKAAEQASRAMLTAQLNLGIQYARGYGVMQSDEEAAVRWLKAAEQGHAAQNSLCMFLLSGRGVVQSDREAEIWWRKGAEQGHAGGSLIWALNSIALASTKGTGKQRCGGKKLQNRGSQMLSIGWVNHMRVAVE